MIHVLKDCGLEARSIRADYIDRIEMGHLLAALMPANRLVLELSMATGLRVGDCVALPTAKLARRMTVREAKTGKAHRVSIPKALYERLAAQTGAQWVFEGRGGPDRHRTTSAVYKDLRRAATLYRMPKWLHVSPHTARKIYAVEAYRRTGDIAAVQRLLCHDDPAVTMIYAMADVLTARRGPQRGR